jgi:hypothetical protein
MLRDEDDEKDARYGIPVGPPELDLPWEEMKKEMNNLFVENGIFTWDEMKSHPVGLKIVCTVVKRHVAASFKWQATNDKKVKN